MNATWAAPILTSGLSAGIFALTAAFSYFFGCFNGAVLISKYILHDDIRTHGSGNAGLTNFYRVFGGKLTFLVIFMDFLKAIFAILLTAMIFRSVLHAGGIVLAFSKYWAGLFCLLGHMFPCMFHFKGGKGILSGGAMAIAIDWRIALAVWAVFFVLAFLTKYVSLGSICCAATFPVASGFVYRDPVILIFSAVIGGLVIWQHRANIKRLASGTESKFSMHHKKKTEGQE